MRWLDLWITIFAFFLIVAIGFKSLDRSAHSYALAWPPMPDVNYNESEWHRHLRVNDINIATCLRDYPGGEDTALLFLRDYSAVNGVWHPRDFIRQAILAQIISGTNAPEHSVMTYECFIVFVDTEMQSQHHVRQWGFGFEQPRGPI